jgi:AbrB family looped-hinge helix DNA binding protein
MDNEAKLTSKGQITIPKKVRTLLGVSTGDRLRFEPDQDGVRVRVVRAESRFAKYQGIGTPGIRGGRKGINKWLREMRGK